MSVRRTIYEKERKYRRKKGNLNVGKMQKEAGSSMGSNTTNVEKWEQAAHNTITRSAGAPIRIHHTLSLPTVIIIILQGDQHINGHFDISMCQNKLVNKTSFFFYNFLDQVLHRFPVSFYVSLNHLPWLHWLHQCNFSAV